jgi:glutathione reductase (NADPH)
LWIGEAQVPENAASSNPRFDLVVIGTGAAGSTPATKCAAAGWKVAVVDDQPYGGTCALRGCDPKKVLVTAAQLVAWQRRMAGAGIAGTVRIDWPALMRFKRTFTADVPEKREASFRKAGIATYHGNARFIAEDRLLIDEEELEAEHFVIASGAKPRELGIRGEEQLLTSTDFLELDGLPNRIGFVGAGYIGFEFAHIARLAGAAVTLFESAQILPQFEPEHVAMLVAHTRELGIDLQQEAEVTAVDPQNGSLRVQFNRPDGERHVIVDAAVHSSGRVPATDELDLGAANIEADEKGAVRVNDYLQSTSNPRVYAAGDAALPGGSIPLTPVAAHEGAIVASNLLKGNTRKVNYAGVASIIFTDPPLASVGLTEQAAREPQLDVAVKSGETGDWLASRRVGQKVGAYKTITDKSSGRLLGAHLLGHNADEMINLFALAVRAGLKSTDVRHAILGFPTSTADTVYMV